MRKLVDISQAELDELRQATKILEGVLAVRMADLVEPSDVTVKGCQGCSGSCSGTCGGSCAGSCKGGCKGTCNALCSTVCTMLGS